MTRRRALIASIAAVALALIITTARCSLDTPSYPSTTQGWTERWDAAAQEFDRMPGEGWDTWLDISPDLETATVRDDAAVLLDRLVPVGRFTVPAPALAGTEAAYDQVTPQLMGMRRLMQEFVIPGLSDALDAGDTDAAAAWIERAWALARVSEASGTLFAGMIQGHIVTQVLDTAGDHTGVIAASDGARIIALLEAAPLPDIAWSLRMERELGLGIISEHMEQRAVFGARDEPRIYERILQDWVAYERDGDRAARDRARRIGDRLEHDRIYAMRRPMLEMLVPSMERAGLHFRAPGTRRDGLLVMIALERWRIEHGIYPDTLGALAPGYLGAVPDDRYAARPLTYRVIDPGSDDPAEAYLLYSVGANGTDNGGVVDPFGPDAGLTTPNYPGDYVFNQRATPPAAGGGGP
ncbi:MAG: hypothetical protein LAT64_11065 [Phycisphaerales bacterium]|nr:hypothetical protein [Planctomycetota bacterium]MCH8509291.1 hypothetical protein [Phycisphaerales bacterium]